MSSTPSSTPRPGSGSWPPSPRSRWGTRIAFPRLQELLDMTAGNLSTHLRKLEDAGYVEVTKTHQGRTPVTYLALTQARPPRLRGLHGHAPITAGSDAS